MAKKSYDRKITKRWHEKQRADKIRRMSDMQRFDRMCRMRLSYTRHLSASIIGRRGLTLH